MTTWTTRTLISGALAAGLALAAAAPGTAAAPPGDGPAPAAPAAGHTDPFDRPGVGADLPFVDHQAEDARTNGRVLGPDWAYGTLAAEAVGRKAVHLEGKGQYVEFTLTEPANAVNVRLSIPDSADGKGLDSTLGVVVDGKRLGSLPVTSRYSWYYGVFPWTNNPDDGGRRQLYDDARIKMERVMPAGTTVRLEIGAGDDAPSYTIDSADFERVAPPVEAPAGSISIVDRGADPTGKEDSTAALQATVDEASAAGKTVWVPPGTFTVTDHVILDRVTVRGAGPWYSVLTGDRVGLYGKYAVDGGSSDVHVSDLAILGEVTERDDSDQVNGIGGSLSSSTVDNVWIQHTKVGAWLDGPFDDLHLSRLRILDQTADGLNFHQGVTNSSVTNSFVRGTGDDGLAMWSDASGDAAPNSGNTFSRNTVVAPTLANTIAVYGGSDNTVSENLVMDTLTQGAGVQVSNRFGSVPVAGTTTVSGNVLQRTGSLDLFSRVGNGALWLWAGDAPMTGKIDVRDNEILDSAYEAVHLSGDHPVSNVAASGNTVRGAGTFGVQLNTTGSGRAVANTATGLGAGGLYDCASGSSLTFQRGNTGFGGSACDYPTPGPLTLSAGELTLTADGLGAASEPQTVTVTNPSATAQPIASVTTTGAYALETTCGDSLAPGASCTATLTFRPTVTGDRGGALTVSDGTSAGRYQVYLTGKVTGPPVVGDVALGAETTATSQVPGYEGRTLTDGDDDTYWESAPNAFPQSATVDLGAAVDVSRVSFSLPGPWGDRTQNLEVQASTDGETFTTIAPAADYLFTPGQNNTVSVDVPGSNARYLRVVVASNTGWVAAQLSSFRAFR